MARSGLPKHTAAAADSGARTARTNQTFGTRHTMTQTIIGTAADEALAAGDEAADINGQGGDDTLTGSAFDDVLEGEDGSDVLAGGDGDDVLLGGRGGDAINTGLGDDVVFGGDGNDSIGGMAGTDFVAAGRGNDFIAWNDPLGDFVLGGAGNDTIIGGDVAADTIQGGAGRDLIRAFATNPGAASAGDILEGNGGRDIIQGGDAADFIQGGGGRDVLTGNRGADQFFYQGEERTGRDVITDFELGLDTVLLNGFFGIDFDPLAALHQTAAGAVLDLGYGDQVLFAGRTVFEFSADDFFLV